MIRFRAIAMAMTKGLLRVDQLLRPKWHQNGSTILVLVCPCFRENLIVTYKIVSLCSLDNFLLKNVILFAFLEIKFQNGAHLKKGLFLTYFSHFLVKEKIQKILLHISHLNDTAHISIT